MGSTWLKQSLSWLRSHKHSFLWNYHVYCHISHKAFLNKLYANYFRSPPTSQSTSYTTGLKLRALDINQARTHAVLAGGKILKTVRVDDVPNCSEEFNLRTAPLNIPSDDGSEQDFASKRKSPLDAGDPAALQRETFDIEDVAWSNNEFKDHVATAARNGKIMLYNMKRDGIEIARLHEHLQQVHKVDFNPLEGGVLLSGSQDGTVRLWDLHSLQRSAMLCSSRDTYQGRSSGVRHVKWSPTSTWTFAFCTDTGIIQRWDTRNNRTPLLKIVAHDGHCNSIDWHPDGRHLVSGGADGLVKIWDMNPDDKRQKAAFSLRAPHDIHNVRWRPSCHVLDSPEFTVKQCTHLATSYRNYPVVHVWDLRRPLLPFREIHHNINTSTTDMLWRTRDLLWTVGPEGGFNQTDMHYTPKTIDRRPLSVFASSPIGEINFYAKKRPIHRGVKMNNKSPQNQQKTGAHTSAIPLEKMSSGRSSGDDSFTERFLSTSMRKKSSRAPSFKSSKSMSTTPPSIEDTAKTDTIDLKLTMHVYHKFNASQTPKIGPLPGTGSANIFMYLAQKCKGPPTGVEANVNYIWNIRNLFNQNAIYAQRASRYRDAQTWRIIGLQIEKELRPRAETNQKLRISRTRTTVANASQAAQSKTTTELTPGQPNNQEIESTKILPLKVIDSTSNMATPVAHAVDDHRDTRNLHENATEPENDLHLPPSLLDSSRNQRIPETSIVSSSFESSDPSWTATRQNIAAHGQITNQHDGEAYLRQFRPQPRFQLSLEKSYQQSSHNPIPPSLERHISGESFAMFSTSTESEHNLSHTSSYVSQVSHDEEQKNESSNVNTTTDVEADDAWGYGDYIGPIPLERTTTRESSPLTSQLPATPFLADAELEDNGMQGPTVDLFPSFSGSITAINNPMRSHSNALGDSVQVDEQVLELARERLLARRMRDERLPRALEVEGEPGDEDFVLADFMPTPAAAEGGVNDPPLVNAREMLQRTLEYYIDQGNVQLPAQLYLLAASALLLPGGADASDALDESSDVGEVAFYDYLTAPALGFLPDEASAVIRNRSNPGNTLGLQPEYIEAFLASYHEQLMQHQQWNAAATLRKWAFPLYPAVYDGITSGYDISLLCQACRAPINNTANRLVCETCSTRSEGCTFCQQKDSPFDLFKKKEGGKEQQEIVRLDALWSCCAMCNHSMHSACVATWFADPHAHGACPVDGCFCDCLPGRYREERLAAQDGAKRGAVRGGEGGKAEGKRVRVVEPGK